MTEIKIIKQQEVLGKEFTVYGTFEEPLMLAKDVAEWLEMDTSNASRMIKNVANEESITARHNNTIATFLTEKGLYQVLVNSRKAVAKELLEALDLGYKIKYKKTPLQTEFTFMLSHFLQEHITSYNAEGYSPTYLEEFRVGKYRLDYYFPEYSIVVEYDENKHKYYLEQDKKREEEVKKILGNEVKFVRVQEGKEFEGIIHIISELSKKFYDGKNI